MNNEYNNINTEENNEITTQQFNQEPKLEAMVQPIIEPIESTANNAVQAEYQKTGQEIIKEDYQIQSELQNIPTVEQNKEQFISNVQSLTHEKKEEKKEGVNFLFIIILFVILLASIYFLFPVLSKYI